METVSQQTLENLSRKEKTQILQWLMNDLADDFSGIETHPNICGGSARIIRTQIPIWSLENARRMKISEADILRDYPTLTAQDLANAWAYVRSHREEIEREIAENELADI